MPTACVGQCPRPSGLAPSLFPSRESKELADLARLHPTGCAANGLNPNLMVTGGPALAGSGRWSADPAAHLATHPWLPRSGSTSMWLAGHPYGEWGPFSLPWWEGGQRGDSAGAGVGGGGCRWAGESQAQLSWLPPSLGAASSPPASLTHLSRRVVMMAQSQSFSAVSLLGWCQGWRPGEWAGKGWAWSPQH